MANFGKHFERPVLGCIEALLKFSGNDFRKVRNYVNASIPKEKTGALSFFESFIFDAKADRFECNHPRDDCTRNVILRSFARSRVISVYHGA